MNIFYLSEINIYPIKSLAGISLQSAHIEEKGLQYDRRWMLIDEEGTFVSQRKHFQLALLRVAIDCGKLIITHSTNPAQTVSFALEESTTENIRVTVWDSTCNAREVDPRVSKWFSDFMAMKVKLVQMPIEEKRFVDDRYAENGEIVSFADGYPCLVIGQSSLNGLNEKLEVPVLMDRFRPNLVFTGGEPHVEDSFNTFEVGGTLFYAVKPCARCVLITVNQQTGVKGHEPLKTLATYRTVNKKVLFGQNLVHRGSGIIRVGDEIKVKDWKQKV